MLRLRKLGHVGFLPLSFLLLIPLTLGAQEPFYKAKTIRIIVGFSPGGGYDTYSRLIARHMGKHIAGNPAIVVENMTGAGSLRAANHVYRVVKPDGLTIGHFIGGLPESLSSSACRPRTII